MKYRRLRPSDPIPSPPTPIITPTPTASRGSPVETAVALTTATNVGLALMGVGTGVLAARLLGADGRGQLAAIQLWPTVLLNWSFCGLPDALTFFTARDRGQLRKDLITALVLGLCFSAPSLLIGYHLMPLLLSAQTQRIIHFARNYLAVLPISVIAVLPYSVFRGLGQYPLWNALRLVPVVGWLLVLLFARLNGIRDPAWLAMGQLCVIASLILPVWAILLRHQSGRSLENPSTPQSSRFRPFLRYSMSSLSSNVPQLLNLRLDQLLLAAMFAPRALGLYVVSVSWSGAVGPALNAVGSVIFPRVASETDSVRRAAVFAQGVRIAFILAAGTVILLVASTPVAFPLLLGPSFSAALPTVILLVLAAGIAGVNGVLEEGLRGMGHPAAPLRAEVAGLLVTGATLYLLLPRWGLIGAAVSSVLSYSVVMALLVAQARRYTSLSVQSIVLPTREDLGFVALRLRSLFGRLRATRG